MDEGRSLSVRPPNCRAAGPIGGGVVMPTSAISGRGRISPPSRLPQHGFNGTLVVSGFFVIPSAAGRGLAGCTDENSRLCDHAVLDVPPSHRPCGRGRPDFRQRGGAARSRHRTGISPAAPGRGGASRPARSAGRTRREDRLDLTIGRRKFWPDNPGRLPVTCHPRCSWSMPSARAQAHRSGSSRRRRY